MLLRLTNNNLPQVFQYFMWVMRKRERFFYYCKALIGGLTMKVIYSCYWGSCLALAAASLHLGFLNEFHAEDILKLPDFGKMNYDKLGRLFYMGTDMYGRKVYIIGSKKSGKIIERAYNGFAKIYGIGKNCLQFVELSGLNNFYISLGLLISRVNMFNRIGMMFLLLGLKKVYGDLNRIVEKTKREPDKMS